MPEYTELASPLKTLSTNASRTLRFIAGNLPLAWKRSLECKLDWTAAT